MEPFDTGLRYSGVAGGQQQRARENAALKEVAALGYGLQGPEYAPDEPQSTTALVMSRIEQRVHAFAELTSILERKLGPVLTPEGPQQAGGSAAKGASTVPPTRLLATLEMLEQMLDQRLTALSSVANRIVL